MRRERARERARCDWLRRGAGAAAACVPLRAEAWRGVAAACSRAAARQPPRATVRVSRRVASHATAARRH